MSALTENRVFLAVSHPRSEKELARQVERGELTAGLVIPPDFDRALNDFDEPRVIQRVIVLGDRPVGGEARWSHWQPKTMSASRSVLVPQSGMMGTPFEAMTGLPPGAACHQR